MLRHVIPTGAAEIHDLGNEPIQLHGPERRLPFALTVELAHTGNSVPNVVDCALNDLKLTSALRAELLLMLEKRVGVQGYR